MNTVLEFSSSALHTKAAFVLCLNYKWKAGASVLKRRQRANMNEQLGESLPRTAPRMNRVAYTYEAVPLNISGVEYACRSVIFTNLRSILCVHCIDCVINPYMCEFFTLQQRIVDGRETSDAFFAPGKRALRELSEQRRSNSYILNGREIKRTLFVYRSKGSPIGKEFNQLFEKKRFPNYPIQWSASCYRLATSVTLKEFFETWTSCELVRRYIKVWLDVGAERLCYAASNSKEVDTIRDNLREA